MLKLLSTAAVAGLLTTGAFAEGMSHKLAIHVDEDDPQLMNMALNNAANVASYYAEQGDTVTIELVTYGPGLKMLTADSPVADRISAMSLETPDISFAACANTMAGIEKKNGKKPKLLEEATVVPSGVVRLIELQEDGYAYVRP